MKRLFLLLLCFPLLLFSQNEGNIWYFGWNAGLDFNSGAPVALTDGQLFTLEGCASMSDMNGDLLFYTDGMVVYNKNHVLMPNGSGLLGHNSSTQSAIIIKKPSSSTIYYIFTVDGMSGLLGGSNYSEVDMTLESGLGNVNAVKNIPIVTYACEKITAIQHQNGTDFWIVIRLENSNTYHTFLLTSGGLNIVPVISNIGPVYNSEIGYLRSSNSGDKIAAANYMVGSNVNLFDFDNTTGILSNEVTLTNTPFPYGVEFSPDGKILYVSNVLDAEIYQFDLLASNIESTKVIVGTLIPVSGFGNESAACLQLAPDNKIYIANISSNYLSVINNPNVLGMGCNFAADAVDLLSSTSGAGLPTFYSSIFLSNSITYINLCYGDSTLFTSSNVFFDSIEWNFGDINSSNNSSTDTSAYHVFSDTGNFEIILSSYLDGNISTSSSFLYIMPIPEINLGNDTSICIGENLLLDVSNQNSTYQWMDNSINSTYEVNSEGDYWVQITDANGCTNTDTIYVITNPLPEANLGEDIVLCEGDTLLLDATQKNATYLWQDNSTLPTYTATITNNYSVIVTDSNACINSDIMNAVFNPGEIADFTFSPQPTDLNNPEITFINTSSNDTTLIWNLGDGTIIEDETYFHHIYESAGEYTISLIIINRYNCVDTIDYKVIIDPGKFHLFIPNSFTPNNDGHNELFVIKGRYIIEFSLKIFNQWGKQLFASSDINKYWDGRYKGKISPQDKYTYLITVLDINGDTHEFTGVIHLIQ
jgi:gliding motility-associated-like protein